MSQTNMSCDKTSSATNTSLGNMFMKFLSSQSSRQNFVSSCSSSSSSEPGECWDETVPTGTWRAVDGATRTENGALSFASSGDARLDLFFKTVRGISQDYLFQLLDKSWEVSPRDTLRTMFYVRDCRGGKGERKIFWSFMTWLWNKDQTLFEKNIPCVPFYGSFRDLRMLLDMVPEELIISYWCDVIGKDVEGLNRNENITLAAKWIPIQDGRFCRKMNLTHKLFRKMIRLLREKLDIVECKMSAGEWEKIYFEKVCSLSMKRYSKAFAKHCQERFIQYLESVNKGEKKMNVGQLYPSDIAAKYLSSPESDPTMDVAWEQLLKKTREQFSSLGNKKFMCVVDTSGSMRGKPLEVAVSLGLFLSELFPESKFYRQFVTFSMHPTLQTVQGNTLFERINNLSKANWDMNTDLQKVFELLLESSTPEDSPDVLLILSDMQFDVATSSRGDTTNLESIEQKYQERGLTRPRLVFWNLRANTIDFPAESKVSNCALVSGYSTSLLEGLLNDGDISPMTLFRKTIDSTRYDMVCTETN